MGWVPPVRKARSKPVSKASPKASPKGALKRPIRLEVDLEAFERQLGRVEALLSRAVSQTASGRRPKARERAAIGAKLTALQERYGAARVAREAVKKDLRARKARLKRLLG